MTDRSLGRAVLLQDMAAVVASAAASSVIREWLFLSLPGLQPAVPRAQFLPILAAYVPLWVWCAGRAGLHQVRTVAGPPFEIVRALVYTQATAALALGALLMAAQASLNRSYVVVFLVTSTLLLLACKFPQRRWVRRERGEVLALVLGEARGAVEELTALKGRRVEVLAEVDPALLRRRLHAGGVDEVVIPAGLAREALTALFAECQQVGVPVVVRTEGLDLGPFRPYDEVVGSALYLTYQRREPDAPTLLLKAALDRVLAAGGLVVMAPLMVLVAVLIKSSSRGPIFFVQMRGGLNGRAFRMLKFRTMRRGAEEDRAGLLPANEMDGPVFKMSNDPRVTALGRLLRRTSIDELPQLVNVLLGHMSLVGPRPLPLVETQALTGGHRRRLSVRPGITGLWQVSGRSHLSFKEWMRLDLHYVDHWSLGLDLAILLRTLPALITGRGAR